MTSGGRVDGGLAGPRRGAAPWPGHLREDRRGAGLGPEFGGWGGATPPAQASPRGLSAAVPGGRSWRAGSLCRAAGEEAVASPAPPPGQRGAHLWGVFHFKSSKSGKLPRRPPASGTSGKFPRFSTLSGAPSANSSGKGGSEGAWRGSARVPPALILELSRLTFQAARSRKQHCFRQAFRQPGRGGGVCGRGLCARYRHGEVSFASVFLAKNVKTQGYNVELPGAGA